MVLFRKIHNLLYPKRGKILMLHSVKDPSLLESLIFDCRNNGFETVSIDEAVERIRKHCKKRFACFTFDDGYLDTYTIAYPIMVRLNVPFCVYMTRDFYCGFSQPVWDPSVSMMNVEQMKEMSGNPLCTIGVHTCSHPHLSLLDEASQRREIALCKADLEARLEKEIRHLAYPHGDYNGTTIQIISELGFITAVTTSGRFVRDDSRLLELDRVFVRES